MWFYWIIVPLAWLVWHIAFRIRVIGRENLIHDRGFVIAPNHISAIDPVFVVTGAVLGQAHGHAWPKQELFEISRLLSTGAWRHVGVVLCAPGKGRRQQWWKTLCGEVRERPAGRWSSPRARATKDGQPG